jgi:hypothetical protein
MESTGSYGSKIQTLIRHLLYIQYTDPGAKSIIFSAWADSLQSQSFDASVFMFDVPTSFAVIEYALKSNG